LRLRTVSLSHIGAGGCKSEELLQQVFAPHGEVVSAQIRERADADGEPCPSALN
jgi:hypothetical protein